MRRLRRSLTAADLLTPQQAVVMVTTSSPSDLFSMSHGTDRPNSVSDEIAPGGRRTRLCEMNPDDVGDFFVMMVGKELKKTKHGKPYYQVTFTDAKRKVSFPVWEDAAIYPDCEQNWEPGKYYKIRAKYFVSSFGFQLDVEKIRLVEEKDRSEGFHEGVCDPAGDYDGPTLFQDLVDLAKDQIRDPGLTKLAVHILTAHRETLLDLPAATANHHAHRCGWLVHVLSVARNAIMMADKYVGQYQTKLVIRRDLVVAGAVLHDIGKVQELTWTGGAGKYQCEGDLIGHILLGRDIVRDAIRECQADPSFDLDLETQLRLEHIIVSHHRLPEFGSPKPPMTPEALIVHFADDLDAKVEMMACLIQEIPDGETMSNGRSILGHKVFKGTAVVPPPTE